MAAMMITLETLDWTLAISHLPLYQTFPSKRGILEANGI